MEKGIIVAGALVLTPLLLNLTCALGVMLAVQAYIERRRRAAEIVRLAWALELLDGYAQDNVSDNLQRWGIETAITDGLMPRRFTLWRWSNLGYCPYAFNEQLRARYDLLTGITAPQKLHLTAA